MFTPFQVAVCNEIIPLLFFSFTRLNNPCVFAMYLSSNLVLNNPIRCDAMLTAILVSLMGRLMWKTSRKIEKYPRMGWSKDVGALSV